MVDKIWSEVKAQSYLENARKINLDFIKNNKNNKLLKIYISNQSNLIIDETDEMHFTTERTNDQEVSKDTKQTEGSRDFTENRDTMQWETTINDSYLTPNTDLASVHEVRNGISNGLSENKNFLNYLHSPGNAFELMENLELLSKTRVATKEYGSVNYNNTEDQEQIDYYSQLIRKNKFASKTSRRFKSRKLNLDLFMKNQKIKYTFLYNFDRLKFDKSNNKIGSKVKELIKKLMSCNFSSSKVENKISYRNQMNSLFDINNTV